MNSNSKHAWCVPDSAVDAHVRIRAIDQQHIRASRSVFCDEGVKSGGAENRDVIVDIVHKNCDRPCSTQSRGACGGSKNGRRSQVY